ncbi:hypothetical protein H9Q72_013300 [Fusarium xylarioides]|uniref:Uncharacterized protein n=1 Tax=Fusarium xylarioides TaxID=221167 RepID=A0A9P7HKC3_9HYPO|nr:hypothetical protein H9Q72_013300 [Fusarium xylarioides]
MRRLESEQAALHADRREQQRRMEQAFNDQLVRLERERKAREAKIQDLETRLSTERADANERFQAAMAESNRMGCEYGAGCGSWGGEEEDGGEDQGAGADEEYE